MASALDVGCAFCGAKAGEPCKSPSTGNEKSTPHTMRVNAAKKTGM